MSGRRLGVVFGLPAAVCAFWTIYAGKDVNWDLLNYHYYGPYELLGWRFGQDYFAASAQSYLNPLGYVPFYVMVSSGWHSVAVSVILAIAHSASIALLFLIAWRLFAHRLPADRLLFSCLASALGSATAVYWTMVGSSFLDPLLAPAVLGALLLLLGPANRTAVRLAAAGVLLGAAAALKYSNAIYAIAALPAALAASEFGLKRRCRSLLPYTAGVAVGLAVFAGPWFVIMMREFGNPVFPLMNSLFHSPYAPPVNSIAERFAPHSLAAAAGLPLRMALLSRGLYVEIFAPDIRFPALAAVLLVLPVVWRLEGRTSPRALHEVDARVASFFAVGWVLWLATSANGRYGLVLLLIGGVFLARMLERLLPGPAARIALAVLLALQLALTALASPSRWFLSEPWSQQWLPYHVPDRWMRERALYLSVEMLPMAVIAPFLSSASSFVNFRGQNSLPPDAPRLAELLRRYRGHVRILARSLALAANGRPQEAAVRAHEATVARIGYRIDPLDCFTIEWRPDDRDALSRMANWLAGRAPGTEPLSVVSCGLRSSPIDRQLAQGERRVSAIFDRIEKGCTPLFHGNTAATDPFGSGWSRHYVGLDARMETIGESVVLNRYRAGTIINLGRLSDWEREGAPLPAACAAPRAGR